MKKEKESCRMEAGSQAQNQMTSMNKAKSEGRFFFSRPEVKTSTGFHLFSGQKLDSSMWLHSPLSSSGPCQCLQPHPGSWPLLMVQPVVHSFTFSLFPNTKTISVWHRSSFSHLQVTLAQAICHPLSLGWERSPHPLLTVSLMLPRFIASVSVAISRN